jgi:dihydrofolate reductase
MHAGVLTGRRGCGKMTGNPGGRDVRQLIYLVACTADGFIARRDGSFDCFPAEGDHLAGLVESFPETIPGHLRDALGVRAANRLFDTVLMGRRTYEVGLAAGVTSPYPHLKQYVFSRGMVRSPDAEVELVSGDAGGLVRELKRREGMDLWLCGGGDLAAALLPEIDGLILKVNPLLLGTGIPLVAGAARPTGLELTGSRAYGSGVILLHYRVRR